MWEGLKVPSASDCEGRWINQEYLELIRGVRARDEKFKKETVVNSTKCYRDDKWATEMINGIKEV